MTSFLPPNVQTLNTSDERSYSVNRAGKPAYQGNGGKRGRRPAPPLPKVFDPGSGTLLDQYTAEKRFGIRRESGALKLKRLTFRHRKIIALHIQGFSNEQVAFYMNVTHLTVSRILNDPLAQEYIGRAAKDRENELKALMGQAVGVVREGLTKEGLPIETRLKAVDRYTKLRQALTVDSGTTSAEDIIAKMLERAKTIQFNQQVNIGLNGADASRVVFTSPDREAPHDAKPPQGVSGAGETELLSGSGGPAITAGIVQESIKE